MLFDSTCARTVSEGDYYSKFVREGAYPLSGLAPKFITVGKCGAKVFDRSTVNQNNLMYLGTVTFNVSDPLNTLKLSKAKNSIVCVQDKSKKIISVKNPKCPSGYKKK
jgi:hypothetical protein